LNWDNIGNEPLNIFINLLTLPALEGITNDVFFIVKIIKEEYLFGFYNI